jgi:DNA-binding transcriptional MocR family regulator
VETTLTTVLARGQGLRTALQELVKSYIFTNNLKPGDPLPSEGQFGRDLQVSRVDADTILDLVQIRKWLEVAIMRHIASPAAARPGTLLIRNRCTQDMYRKPTLGSQRWQPSL